MRVADIMTNASVTESPSDSLRSAADTMWRQQTGSLLVMDGDDLVGIITERDVMKAVAQGRDVDATPVSDVMTKDVLTITPDTSAHEAARHMASRWIRHLPVLEGSRVVGVVSQRDLVGVFAALAPDPDGADLPNDQLVRELRLARIEHGDLD
ncbi:MAG TPA: CBS domain-containing protein [Frankiaceae bacterium]|nr:CBS domain-containing protein [Frankiaceae bacterium]